MLLRCTQKLLIEMRLKKQDLKDFTGEVHPLDDWYAHLFYLYRRKCVMFMHAKTRFPFVVTDVKRKELKSIEDIFSKGLARAFYEENYPSNIIKMFNDRIRSVQIAPTIDKSVIGSLNEFIRCFPYIHERFYNGEQFYDGPQIGHELRRIPVLKHGFPDENMKKLLLSYQSF